MLTRDQIYALDDLRLVEWLAAVPGSATWLDLSDWERNFLSTAPEHFAVHQRLSWKQRKSARHLLLKVFHVAEQRREEVSIRARLQRIHAEAERTGAINDPMQYVDDEPSGGLV